MRPQFIGIGPGRCGTQSLARIVDACKNTRVTHEAYCSAWYKKERPIEALRGHLLGCSVAGILGGDCQSHILPHLPHLRRSIPTLKVVCLHRDKHEVVESFLDWLAGTTNLRPKDKNHRLRNEEIRKAVWVSRFPTIDADTPRQAWEFYWEMYEAAMSRLDPPVYHLRMESLNEDAALADLFEFLEIPASDRVFPEQRVWNSRAEIRRRMETAQHGVRRCEGAGA